MDNSISESTDLRLVPAALKVRGKTSSSGGFLSFLKIADKYERKARLSPALLAILPLIVLTLSLNLGNESWVKKLLTAGGMGGVMAIALAQFASAAGNRFGERFWKARGGLPTLRWLRSTDSSHSSAQKVQWYSAILRLTGLDLSNQTTTPEEDALISDAVHQLRYKFRGRAQASMLDTHNAEYGFARNLAGLRWLMLTISLIGATGSAMAWWFGKGSPWGSVINAVILIFALCMFFWLPAYVERAGNRYAESFFAALLALSSKAKERKSEAKDSNVAIGVTTKG